MTQGERTDFQGTDREVVLYAPIGVGFELIVIAATGASGSSRPTSG